MFFLRRGYGYVMWAMDHRVAAWIGSILLFTAAAGAEVTITRAPAVVEHKTFNPANRPADMPPLRGSEAAVTQSSFECQVEVNYEVVARKPADGRCAASIKLQGVHMTLRMKIVVWLPEHAPEKLKAHEEGHRQIDQSVYHDADRAARQIAQAMDGQTITEEGPTCAAAEKQATDTAAGKLCRLYIDRVGKRAARISDFYDQITAHGTRAKPEEDEAIRQAFARDAQATTRPNN